MFTNFTRNRAVMRWLDEILANPSGFMFQTGGKLVGTGIVLWAIEGLISHRSVVQALKALFLGLSTLAGSIGSGGIS